MSNELKFQDGNSLHDEREHARQHAKVVHHSFAEDPVNGQLTVLGTMGQDGEHKPKVPITSWIIVLIAGIACFQNVFQAVAPAANAYTIAALLNGNSKRLWIVQAGAIPSIASGPISSIISDIYGRKISVCLLTFLGVFGNIVCMLAKDINVLIAGQTINGVACGISGLNFAIASEVVPTMYRAHVQMFLSMIGGVGAIVALMGCGAAITADPVNGWRWVWRIQLILNGLTLLGFVFMYKPPPRTIVKGSFWHKAGTLDWVGYILLTGGAVPLLMGFAWAGELGWSDPHAYGCVVAGFAGLIACCIWEWKGTATGFLHHALFREGRNFPLFMFIIAVEGHMFYSINNIYTGAVYGVWFPTESTIKQSSALLPYFLTVMIVSPIISWYSTKYKDLKWPILAGLVVFLVAVIGLATCDATSWKRALAFDALMGFGFASLLMLLMANAQMSCPPLYIGVASSLAISSRTLGGTIGYGISSVIYSNLYNKWMPDYIAKAVAPLGFDMSHMKELIIGILSHNLSNVPGATPQIIGAAMAANAKASVKAYGIVWHASIPAVFLAIIGILFTKSTASRMDWVVDAPLKGVNITESDQSLNVEHSRDTKVDFEHCEVIEQK